MILETIEDLITRLKSVEISAHIWKWETSNAAEIEAINYFYEDLHYKVDSFITLTISDAGFKDGGFYLNGFSFIKIEDLSITQVANEVKKFLYEKVKTANAGYMPEVEAMLTDIITTLKQFNYKMMLD
jgi:hypothetical protein